MSTLVWQLPRYSLHIDNDRYNYTSHPGTGCTALPQWNTCAQGTRNKSLRRGGSPKICLQDTQSNRRPQGHTFPLDT